MKQLIWSTISEDSAHGNAIDTEPCGSRGGGTHLLPFLGSPARLVNVRTVLTGGVLTSLITT